MSAQAHIPTSPELHTSLAGNFGNAWPKEDRLSVCPVRQPAAMHWHACMAACHGQQSCKSLSIAMHVEYSYGGMSRLPEQSNRMLVSQLPPGSHNSTYRVYIADLSATTLRSWLQPCVLPFSISACLALQQAKAGKAAAPDLAHSDTASLLPVAHLMAGNVGGQDWCMTLSCESCCLNLTCGWHCRRPRLVPASEEGRCLVCALPLTDLVAFSSLRIYLDTDLKRSDTRARGLQACLLSCAWQHAALALASVSHAPAAVLNG